MTITSEQLNYHNAETLKYIREVSKLLGICIRNISVLQEIHDESKLESPEREIYAEALPRLEKSSYGTPEYYKMLESIQPAIDHHYKYNPHHPEFHRDGIKGMDLFQLMEMICDWIAATQRHRDGDINKSIEKNQTRFGYSEELKQIFKNTVEAIRNKN